MYYTRLTQTRRVGQRLTTRQQDQEQIPSPSLPSDVFEFGADEQADSSFSELELCKGLMYPVD